MPTIDGAITDLTAIIQRTQEKSEKTDRHRNDEAIRRSQIDAAESRIESAESSVARAELKKQEAEDKLSPPPTKTEASSGKKGGPTKVVDEREKNKLESQVRAADLEIQQAQAAVDTAREEADALKNEDLVEVGVSTQTQDEMNNLESLVNELKNQAKDPQVDLTGEEYQEKLEKAINEASKLADEIPDDASAALADFWEDISTGFQSIHDSINDYITPKPAEISSSNNYSAFFDDVDQGYNSIIGYLEANGADQEVLREVENSRDVVSTHRTTYLGGMTSEDDETLGLYMTHINKMVADINNGHGIDAEQIAELSVQADEVNTIMSQGGSSFEDVIAIPFNTIAVNTDEISRSVVDNPEFDALYSRLDQIYNGNYTFAQLQGITVEEVDLLYSYSDFSASIKEKFRNGTEISNEEMSLFITQGHELADLLETRYGFSGGGFIGGANGVGGGGFGVGGAGNGVIDGAGGDPNAGGNIGNNVNFGGVGVGVNANGAANPGVNAGGLNQDGIGTGPGTGVATGTSTVGQIGTSRPGGSSRRYR